MGVLRNPIVEVNETMSDAYRESPVAMTAFEASLVVSDSISCQRLDEMNNLITGFAFLCGAAKRHSPLGTIYDQRKCLPQQAMKQRMRNVRFQSRWDLSPNFL